MNEKERIQEAYEKSVLGIWESVGGPGSYEEEKAIAMKMKAKGYKMVILFPSGMNLSPLYVKDTLSASRLMRNEFKKVKGYKIMKISEFASQKSAKEKKEEEANEDIELNEAKKIHWRVWPNGMKPRSYKDLNGMTKDFSKDQLKDAAISMVIGAHIIATLQNHEVEKLLSELF